jgi:inosose dehydratase
MDTALNFALSLDLVDLDHQEPNRNRRESKYYWDELFPLITAAGFQGIELPYQPKWDFGGRSGIPFTRYAIDTKYGSVDRFTAKLHDIGLERIAGILFDPSLFISNNLDAYFGAFGHFAAQAVQMAGDSGAGILTLAPTPCFGILDHLFGRAGNWDGFTADFLKRTADLINGLAQEAKRCGVTITLKNDYWSLLRDRGADAFSAMIDSSVRIDIDTASIQIAGQNPVDEIGRQAGKIGSVHFTDTAFVDTANDWRGVNPGFPASHATQVFRDIGQGTVDLHAAYQALQASGYKGWIVCSCRQTRDVARALLRTRHEIDHMILKV